MIVIGAGMAGLLAAAMLRNECTQIIEAQDKIPNNHSAVLRFRSRAVSDVLNIPFKKVEVMKASHPWLNPVADAMSYSLKTNGTATIRSITTATGEINTRYIAPPDLIQQMAERITGTECVFGVPITLSDIHVSDQPIISTMPMPVLMKLLEWPNVPEFDSVGGVNITATIENADAYCSLYVPNPGFAAARISLTGNQMIAECPNAKIEDLNFELQKAIANTSAALLGLNRSQIKGISAREQKYAKILPIDDQERKRFMLWATENFNVYSLGRFATWRPGLLLDDVVNDVRVIHNMINGGSTYDHRKELS